MVIRERCRSGCAGGKRTNHPCWMGGDAHNLAVTCHRRVTRNASRRRSQFLTSSRRPTLEPPCAGALSPVLCVAFYASPPPPPPPPPPPRERVGADAAGSRHDTATLFSAAPASFTMLPTIKVTAPHAQEGGNVTAQAASKHPRRPRPSRARIALCYRRSQRRQRAGEQPTWRAR